MKKRPFLFLQFVVAVAASYVLHRFPALITAFVQSPTFVGILLAALISTPLTLAYNRLGSMDKLDGVPAQQVGEVVSFIRKQRKHLVFLLKAGVIASIATMLLLFVAAKVPQVLVALPFILPIGGLVLSIVFFLSLEFLSALECSRETIHDLQRKAEARKKLIERMRKEACESPMQPNDPHLAQYRQVA